MPPSNLVPGFLAAGPATGRLPYPPLPLSVQRVVRDAVRHAWQAVRLRAADKGLRDATEPQITTMLQLVLNQILDDDNEPVPGFSSNYFETVERGAEMVNYDGSMLEKRPDLRFRLQGPVPDVPDRTHFGLFVECKLLDNSHPLRLYAAQGIQRFVSGEYAWAMRHAMMLAYVRFGGAHPNDLVTLLNNDPVEWGVASVNHDSPPTHAEDLVRSFHDRPWQYPQSAASPGPIELIHVWLSLS